MYLFIDTETTGLSPTKDHLLEVAWVITGNTFEQISEPRTFLVDHEWEWNDVWVAISQADPVVREMHTKSGLIHDLEVPSDEGFFTLSEIRDYLASDLRQAQSFGGPIHMAGLSVQFDRAFLVANGFGGRILGPGVDRDTLVHHRQLDLTSIKLMLGSAGIPFETPHNEGAHRALNDVFETIEQAKIFRDMLQTMNENHLLVESQVLG